MPENFVISIFGACMAAGSTMRTLSLLPKRCEAVGTADRTEGWLRAGRWELTPPDNTYRGLEPGARARIPAAADSHALWSELAGFEDLVLRAHPPRSVGKRSGAVGQETARGSEQVGAGEETIQSIALLLEQRRGAVVVASNDQFRVVEDVARQSKRIAVVDQRQLASIPAPVARMTVLLGDQRIKERRRQTHGWVPRRRQVVWPSPCL